MARNRAARRREHMMAAVERFDGYAPLRNGLRRIAQERRHWAGIPVPLDGTPLVIEPRYPNAEGLMEIGKDPAEEKELAGVVKRNAFWSDRLRCEVYIWNEPDGRLLWGKVPGANHLAQDLSTLGAADAWGIEQEHKAVQLLGTLVSHRKLKQYLLTGMFLERSARSGVVYLFRRLKPTVAIRTEGETSRILCALCLHPIGYYRQSWAGAMVPTDDIVAHLMLMRGDEVLFWKRANQIAPHRPEAGI